MQIPFTLQKYLIRFENEAVTSNHHYSMTLYMLMSSTLENKMICSSMESFLTPTLTLTSTLPHSILAPNKRSLTLSIHYFEIENRKRSPMDALSRC
jgi:hypothetical protein